MAQTGSVHPLNLIQLVAPYLFADRVIGGSTHEMGLYIGAVPLMLIVWLIVDRRRLGPLQTLARATAWFGGVALVLAMGEFGQLYRLQSFLPLINRFRCPCRYLVLFQLGAAILAAIGFVLLEQVYQRTREGERGQPNPLYPKVVRRVPLAFSKFEGLWAVVIVGGSAALTGLLAHGRPYIAAWPKVLAGPLLLAAAAMLVIAAARGVRNSLIGLIVLAAVDFGCYGMSYAVYAETARLDQVSAAAVAPPAAPGGRVYAPPLPLEAYGNLWTGNQMILRRVEPPGRLRRPGAATAVGLRLAAGVASGLGFLGAARRNHGENRRVDLVRQRLAASARRIAAGAAGRQRGGQRRSGPRHPPHRRAARRR